MKTNQLSPLALTLFAAVLFCATAGSTSAGSATWSTNPTNTDWNVPANWMPATVPNDTSAVATFAASALPQVELFGTSQNGVLDESVAQIIFPAGASRYTITAHTFGSVTFYGAGVVNQSGIRQNFVTDTVGTGVGIGQFVFLNSSSAGSNLNTFTNGGAKANDTDGGTCEFTDDASAGSAVFVNQGGSATKASGGIIFIVDRATASNAAITNNGATAAGLKGGLVNFEQFGTSAQSTIVNNGAENPGGGGGMVVFDAGGLGGTGTMTNNGGKVTGAGGGSISFVDSGDADALTIINNGSSIAGAGAGTVSFDGVSNAGTAVITNNGGTVTGASGSYLSFKGTSSANRAVIIANGGTNGGAGAQVVFSERSTARSAQFKIYGNASLDIGGLGFGVQKFGSLEGDGLVFLGQQFLGVGTANLNTTFSGTIMDGGIHTGGSGYLYKYGRGTLVLTGASTYTGGTTVTAGTLRVSNSSGSGTGPGPVTVNGGLLAGSGVIAGVVTVGTGAADSTIAPSNGTGKSAALATSSQLQFNSKGTYKWTVKSDKATADELIANGVSITTAALFTANVTGGGTITPKTVFTAISNTSANPIGGRFGNLADGAVITANGVTLKANYEGGDGNDLTLTVQ